ncbi:sigma factor [Clostridium paraputrificum]|uniref:sigma factor n=1 Tax=Clostridium paraputrificum TaxID=29363 RepID=UPI003D34ED60
MDYKEIEKLVLKARAGDNKSTEKLIKEFQPFIFNLSSKSFIDGYDITDIQNECYKVLLNTIHCYDIKRHRFVAYATTSIRNSIYLLIRKSKRRSRTDGINALTLGGDLEELNISDISEIDENLCRICESEALKMP